MGDVVKTPTWGFNSTQNTDNAQRTTIYTYVIYKCLNMSQHEKRPKKTCMQDYLGLEIRQYFDAQG